MVDNGFVRICFRFFMDDNEISKFTILVDRIRIPSAIIYFPKFDTHLTVTVNKYDTIEYTLPDKEVDFNNVYFEAEV